jgi:UPF0755 protein
MSLEGGRNAESAFADRMDVVLFDQDDRPRTADELIDEPPQRPRRVRAWLTVVGVLVALGLVVVAAGGLWVKGKIDPPGAPGKEIVFEIPSGVTTSRIAGLLDDAGVVSSGEVFRWYLRVKGGGPFEAGQYHLRLRSSMGDVVTVLEDGPDLPPAQNLTIPEGLWVTEIASRVDKIEHLDGAKFLELARGNSIRSQFQPADVTNLEGFLYPETYRVEDTEDEVAVLRRMVETFDQVASDAGLADAQAKVGVTPYEAIIVASLIESETKLDEERPTIARVIYNRLEQGIPLGIDATFYFALQRRGGSLRQSDLDMDSPYNTRKNAGLVPGPIAMPRRSSIEAALNPAAGPWLYYVLKDEIAHTFTDDYNQFLRDKRAAQEAGLIP